MGKGLRYPKDNITELRLKRGYTGNHQRFIIQMDSFGNNFYLPNPVEYEDIDDAFLDFVDCEIGLVAKGQKVPTYTLFSNHRFSEFSQTYGHTDEDGNLLMDFKTVGRENNPKPGSGQDGLFNIPGNRRYTVGIRSVLDDNGFFPVGGDHYFIRAAGFFDRFCTDEKASVFLRCRLGNKDTFIFFEKRASYCAWLVRTAEYT